MKKFFVFALFCIFLSGCASSDNNNYGSYSETRLGENVFRVFFKGNESADKEQTNDFNMLRCAEIALENGYAFFVVVSTENFSEVSSRSISAGSKEKVVSYSDGPNVKQAVVTNIIPGETYCDTSFGDINTIECFHKKPKGRKLVFEAAFIINSITNKYKLK